jgi:hypothetical protein
MSPPSAATGRVKRSQRASAQTEMISGVNVKLSVSTGGPGCWENAIKQR